MSIVGWFWLSFTVTLGLAVVSLWSGWRGRRKLHLITGPATMVMLTVTILLTERFARARVFPADEMAIHLVFAKVGAALALPVIATGILIAFRPRWRRLHRWSVVVFLIGVVLATGTGIWVFTLSTPK